MQTNETKRPSDPSCQTGIRWPFFFTAVVAQLVERWIGSPAVEGSKPFHRPNFNPALSANCEQGLNLGLAPKAGLVPAVILTLLPEESNEQNDLPQLRIECKRHGRDRKGNQRFQCRQCSKTFLAPQEKPLGGMGRPRTPCRLIFPGLGCRFGGKRVGHHLKWCPYCVRNILRG